MILRFSGNGLEQIEYLEKTRRTLRCERRKGEGQFKWCKYSKAFAVILLLISAWRNAPGTQSRLKGKKGSSAVSTFIDAYDRNTFAFDAFNLFGPLKVNQVFFSSKNSDRELAYRWVGLDVSRLKPENILTFICENGKERPLTQSNKLERLARSIESQVGWKYCNLEADELKSLSEIAPEVAERNAKTVLDKRQRSSDQRLIARLTTYKNTYNKHARTAHYAQAVITARKALRLASNNAELSAQWAAHTGSAYRAQAELYLAGEYYAKAAQCVARAQAGIPRSPEFEYLAGQIEFGQIMVDDFQRYARYDIAFRRHIALLESIDRLLRTGTLSPQVERLARDRRPHVLRQQAENLRYMGRYTDSIAKIDQALLEYPERAKEARYYSQLSRADSHRLIGCPDVADLSYRELEKRADKPGLTGLLASVLWRRIELAKLSGDMPLAKSLGSRLSFIAEEHKKTLGYAILYSKLTTVPIFIAEGRLSEAGSTIEELRSRHHLSPSYLAVEYAYTLLFEGELRRKELQSREAIGLFHESKSIFDQMPVAWGSVRATVGLRLLGVEVDDPHCFVEGVDKNLLKLSKAQPNSVEKEILFNIP